MFLFLKTDAFRNTEQRAESEEDSEKDNGYPTSIRRPYRGIQIKEDTYSTISVRRPDGSAIPLISSSDVWGAHREGPQGLVTEYADYILQSVQDQRTEKQQIIETFGDPFVYFFGERPRIVTFSGLLVNTEDFNWRSQFWKNYDTFFRGTRLVQSNARCYLSYDTIVVEGYPLSASAVDDHNTPYSIPFSVQMLVTNYYDWSSIGHARFPGFADGTDGGDLELLNQELYDARGKYVSTGAEVRRLNLEAGLASGGGLLSTLRSGIRAVNSAISTVSGVADAIHNVVGGRVVRVPIGVAGFVAAQGAPTVATGSITSGTQTQFDAATGEFEGLNGSVKLRVPGGAGYAPPWVSEITNSTRGYIQENLDEYATRSQPESIKDLLRSKDYDNMQERALDRFAAVEANKTLLATHNLLQAGGGFLGDLAEGVNFAKSSFGMAMSALAFVQDPLSVAKASLGIGIGTTSESRIAGSTRQEELGALGIKTQSREGSAGTFGGEAGKYLGFSAAQTFANINDDNVLQQADDNFSLAPQGEVYDDAAYLRAEDPVLSAAEGGTTGLESEDKDYEAVYGDKDYTALVEQDRAAASDTTQTERAETSVQATLDEVYGNNDAAPDGSDIDPASLEEVYGTGSTSSSVRTPEQIAAALQAAQSSDVAQDEDTSGIIAVDDDGAAIDPIV